MGTSLFILHCLSVFVCTLGEKKVKTNKEKEKNWVNYHFYNWGWVFCQDSAAPSTSQKLSNSMIHIKALRTPAAQLKGQTGHLHSEALITVPLWSSWKPLLNRSLHMAGRANSWKSSTDRHLAWTPLNWFKQGGQHMHVSVCIWKEEDSISPCVYKCVCMCV